MNIDPRPPGTKVPKGQLPDKHLVVRVDHESRGPHRNGRKRIRQIVLFACKRAVYGGLRTDAADFAKRCTEDIYRVSCRQCIHEAKALGIEKAPRPKAHIPPPIPVFHDPWASEDTPIGQNR